MQLTGPTVALVDAINLDLLVFQGDHHNQWLESAPDGVERRRAPAVIIDRGPTTRSRPAVIVHPVNRGGRVEHTAAEVVDIFSQRRSLEDAAIISVIHQG